MNRLKCIVFLTIATMIALSFSIIYDKNMTIDELHNQINNFDNVIMEKDAENERLQQEIDNLKDSKYEFKYLDTYKITYY